MPIQLKIKDAAKKRKVAFNNSGLPLGERSDLLELAILAREANDQYLLSFFEGPVPSLKELQEEKARLSGVSAPAAGSGSANA